MTDNQNPKLKWRNRRWMAWLCLVSALLFPFLGALLLSPEKYDLAIWPFFSFVGMVVGTYVGAASVSDIWGKK